MKIQYLGTGAAEGFPALFCSCPACISARALGGKNIKTRSCCLINDTVMIDLSPDIFWQSIANEISLSSITSIIFTHTHHDHLDRFALMLRCRDGASIMPHLPDSENFIDVYGSADVIRAIHEAFATQPHANPQRIHCHILEENLPIEIDGLVCIPIKANHMMGETCYIYCIIDGDQAFLYGNDTGGGLDKESFRTVIALGVTFSVVSLDCSRGTLIGDSHMGMDEISKLCGMLRENSLITESTVICLNHYSHMCGIVPEEFDALIRASGMSLTYDGLTMLID